MSLICNIILGWTSTFCCTVIVYAITPPDLLTSSETSRPDPRPEVHDPRVTSSTEQLWSLQRVSSCQPSQTTLHHSPLSTISCRYRNRLSLHGGGDSFTRGTIFRWHWCSRCSVRRRSSRRLLYTAHRHVLSIDVKTLFTFFIRGTFFYVF